MKRSSPSRGLGIVLALVISSILAAPITASAQTTTTAYADLDRGVYALTVKLAVKPDEVGEFLSLAKARIRQSRTNAGVVDFRSLATTDPDVFVSFESYRSDEAFEAFAKSRETAAFLEKIKPILATAPEVQVLRSLP